MRRDDAAYFNLPKQGVFIRIVSELHEIGVNKIHEIYYWH